jgi:hypothetical protein
MAGFESDPTVTTSLPTFSPLQQDIFKKERDLLSSFILPNEQQRIFGLSTLGRGDFGRSGTMLGPAFSAGRQAQSRLSAGLADLPDNMGVPYQEHLARQTWQIPRRLQAGAPDELAQLVQALIGKQLGGLLTPGTQQTTTGGGPSSFSTASGAVNTLASLATLAAQLFGKKDKTDTTKTSDFSGLSSNDGGGGGFDQPFAYDYGLE